MAWDTDIVTMVRTLIGDVGPTQKYDDDRIATAIVTAGILSTQEFSFKNDYTFTFDPNTITPDPTLESVAMALFSLKAACLLAINNYQTGIGRNIAVRSGDDAVDLKGSFQGYKDIITLGPCGAYDKLIKDLEKRSVLDGNIGGAVFSPFSSGNSAVWGNGTGVGNFYARGFWDSFCI